MSKCEFGKLEVIYLGHIISSKGVSADPKKLKAMIEWPRPTSINALRGFLGLIGCYQRFIKGYGGLASPLTELLEKGGFRWNPEVDAAFLKLKQAMTRPHFLALPYFLQPFQIEFDASRKAIGAVLAQQVHPIAFFS